MPDRQPSREAAERLLLQLTSAINARALYPADHPRVREAVDRLLGGLGSLLEEAGSSVVDLLLVGDDLVVGRLPLRRASVHHLHLQETLRRCGVEALTFVRGIGAEECEELTGALAAGRAPASSPHLQVGQVEIGFGDPTGAEAALPGAGAAPGGGGQGADAGEGGTGAGPGGGGQGADPGEGGTGAGDAGRGAGVGGAGSGNSLTTQVAVRVAAGAEAFAALRSTRRTELARFGEIVWDLMGALAHSAGAMLPLAPLRAHDERTYVHSVNVALLTLGQGRSLGLRGQELHRLGLAALLHDVGKLEVPLAILNKPGRFDAEEWQIVMRHTELGAARLAAAEGSSALAVMVAYEHHLRYDRAPNYPTLRQPRRPALASRMTAVADTFDAVSAKRPNQQAVPREAALQILRDRAGTYLDPLLVERFHRLLGVEPPAA